VCPLSFTWCPLSPFYPHCLCALSHIFSVPFTLLSSLFVRPPHLSDVSLLCRTEVSGLLMSSLFKINALFEGSWWGGNTRGARAVDFKQGTWEDGEFATMNSGSPFLVSNFLFVNTHPLDFLCVQDKKVKKSSLCRLKMNYVSGSETCFNSWYTGTHGNEHLHPLFPIVCVPQRKCIYHRGGM
jgi:hypothetical protein